MIKEGFTSRVLAPLWGFTTAVVILAPISFPTSVATTYLTLHGQEANPIDTSNAERFARTTVTSAYSQTTTAYFSCIDPFRDSQVTDLGKPAFPEDWYFA